MKLIYHGPLWKGGTALQRAEVFAQVSGVRVVQLDTMHGRRELPLSLYERARWKVGWPVDSLAENERLIALARRESPTAIFVDNSKVLSTTLADLAYAVIPRRAIVGSADMAGAVE